MLNESIAPYSPTELGLTLDDIVGEGNLDQLKETLKSGHLTFIRELCRELHRRARGPLTPSVEKRLRVKHLFDEVIADLRHEPDTFNAQARAANIAVKPLAAFVALVYEPR